MDPLLVSVFAGLGVLGVVMAVHIARDTFDGPPELGSRGRRTGASGQKRPPLEEEPQERTLPRRAQK